MNPINNFIVQFVKILPQQVVYIFAKKYVAGPSLDDAIRVVQDLNSKGIMATLDVLGESIKNKSEAEETKKHCFDMLDVIKQNGLDANVSIKPTSLGLNLDKEFCFNQIEEIVKKAEEYNNFIRIDMEDTPYTDSTFNILRRLKEKYDNVGVVVQAYLRRTFDDIVQLNKEGINYRLCKGIYVEPEELAYKGKQEIRDNFVKVLDKMLKDGNYVGIATHDDYLVKESYNLIEKYDLSKDKYEFQMLYGVTESLRDKINSDGHRIRVYVPWGVNWYAYSMRRLQENPMLAWYITKSIFSFK